MLKRLTRHASLSLYILIPLVLTAAIGAAVMIAVDAQSESDSDMSDAERDAHYKTAIAISAAQAAPRIKAFAESGRAVDKLPRASLMLQASAPQYSLKEASEAATEIVVGRVVQQKLIPDDENPQMATILSTIAVAEWLKGKSSDVTITLEQPAGLGQDEKGEYVLGVVDLNPVVSLDHDVVAFSSARSSRGGLEAILLSVLTIEEGKIEPNPLDQELAVHAHAPADEILALIRSYVSAGR